MRVIIAAAGTAGHINPGIAIANKIKKERKDAEIIFIGTTRGIENDLVNRAGYQLKTIEAFGLSAKLSIRNFKNMCATLRGFGQAKKIIKEFKPDIVIGTGGYICGAVISEAHKLNIPTMLHESNAFPGKAVTMLLKHTDIVLVSFKETINRLKTKEKAVYVGTPTKIENKEYSKEKISEIKRSLGLIETIPSVLVFGGSQGAKAINDTLIKIIKQKLNDNYQIVWAPGPKQYDDIKHVFEDEKMNINNIPNVKIFPYIYNMEDVMRASELVICRSGAMTIAEISNIGKPSILIPLPNVSNNHQLHNAEVLQRLGAAKIIENDQLDENKLNDQIKIVIENDFKMQQMSKNALKNASYNVVDTIYEEIEKLVNK